MAINTAKQRMLEGKPAFGAEVNLGSSLSAELLSPLGFDFILVDNQHGAWDDNSSMSAFRSIALGVAMPMARVRRNEFGAIGRLLDRGAMGIVVPMVNSVEEAEAAAEAVRYLPIGGRSAGAFGTGFLGGDYMQWANDEIFLAVQIETVEAAAVGGNPLSRGYRRLLDRPRRPQLLHGGGPVGPGGLAGARRPNCADIRGNQACRQDTRHLHAQRIGGIAPRRAGRAVPHGRRRRTLGRRRRPQHIEGTRQIAVQLTTSIFAHIVSTDPMVN